MGALPVLFFEDISDRLLDVMLGFAAGVMLVASSFSLIIPAIELSNVMVAGIGLGAGALTIHIIDKYTPHLHYWSGSEGPRSERLSRIMLMVLAITIHNFPEGLAVWVSFGGSDVPRGLIIALAIGL